MSASTLRPLKPRNRLEPLATVVTWAFRFAVVATALRVILALLGRGPLVGAHMILGWWLLAGGLVATVTEAFARMNLLAQLVTWNVNWDQWPVAWSVDWPVAWTGLGLVIFARVMRIGAGMRADLEGTV
jgi:hypothetical protein